MAGNQGRSPGALARLVRAHRENAGLTQRQLASLTGISLGAVQDLEQGRTARPRRQSLVRLAAVLRLTGPQQADLLGAAAPQCAPAHGDRASPGLRVTVLGPLAAWRDGSPVSLGSARQRAVLGLLALHGDASLRRAEIIESLWGGRAPATSVAMVQAYIARIRRLLEAAPAPACAAPLAWDGSGYRLDPGSVRLDLTEFTRLAGQAGEIAAADPAAACELYEQALGCWRGEPLQDLEVLREHPAVVALSRRRGTVVVEYARAAASAGRPDRALPQLAALAGREPLDERAHAQLMLTLAAVGRQAAALGIYQDLARRLDEEIGVSPGRELAEAHLKVLRQQVPGPAPAPVTAGRAAPTPVVPRQLPPAVPHFVGRAADLATLTSLLDAAAAAAATVVVSAIGGTPGVGKTALAVHWAHQVAGRFPDGQLYLNLRGFGPAGEPVTAAQAVRQFLDALGVPPERIPASPDAQAGLYRSVLAGRRVLVVLDNVRDPAQARPLLPGAPGCMAVITSRNPLSGLAVADGARLLALDVLTAAQAHELLAARLGPGRATREPAAVAELARLCARLPLALSVVAARAATRPSLPLAALAAEMRGGARLDQFGTGDEATDVRTVFSWSSRQLSPPAARLFRLLGVHPGPDVTLPAAASLAGLPPDGARRALAELTGTHLLSEHAPGRFALHDLLRAYAAEEAAAHENAQQRRDAVHRLLDHYLHTARAGSLLLQPYRDPVTLDPPAPQVRPEPLADREHALAWFQAERQVLLAAIGHAAAAASHGARGWQLPWAVATFLNWHGYWHELATTQRSAAAAAARLGDQAGQAEAHRYLGRAQARLGDYEEASSHLARSLELYRQLGGTSRQARAHLDLGHIREVQGRGQDALGHAEQSLRLYRAAGDRPGEATGLNAVGWLHAQLGSFGDALSHCGLALAAFRELGNRTGEAVALDSLGFAHHHLGNHADAVTCYRRATTTLGDADDQHLRAEMLTRLGDAEQAAGNPRAARGAWHEALLILTGLDHPDAGQVLSRLSGAIAGAAATPPPGY